MNHERLQRLSDAASRLRLEVQCQREEPPKLSCNADPVMETLDWIQDEIDNMLHDIDLQETRR